MNSKQDQNRTKKLTVMPHFIAADGNFKKCLLLVDGVGDQHGRQHREKSLSLSIGGGLLAVAGKGETSTLLAMVLLPLLQQLTLPQTFFLVRAFVLSEGGRLAQTWLLRQS